MTDTASRRAVDVDRELDRLIERRAERESANRSKELERYQLRQRREQEREENRSEWIGFHRRMALIHHDHAARHAEMVEELGGEAV